MYFESKFILLFLTSNYLWCR